MERQPLLWAAAHVRSKTELLCRVVGSERHAPGDIILQFADGQTDLLHGITIPDRHTVVGGVFFITHGLEIHRDTEGRADLVLAAIALTDRATIKSLESCA